jgi:PAS domain S-box-containing protein
LPPYDYIWLNGCLTICSYTMKVQSNDFNELFQHHPLPGWIFDAAKNEIVELNQAAINRYGYTKQECQDLLFFNLLADLDQQVLLTGNAHSCLGQFTHPVNTGELLTVRLYASPYSAANKNLHCITAVELSNKQEEQRLKLLESVVTHSNDAVIVTEAEPTPEIGLKIVYVNDAFTRMTGYTAAEVIGRSPSLLQGPRTNKEELDKLSQAIKDWSTFETTLLNYKKNGEEFWVNFTISPVADNTGWFTHWIAIERDVTHQTRREQENALTLKISHIFNHAAELSGMLEEMCKEIASHHDCCFSEVWLPDTHKDQLQLHVSCSVNAAGELFYQETAHVNRISLEEGIPGRIWSTKEQLLVDVLEDELPFPRKEAAIRTGIRCLVGIPLLFNNQRVGVLITGTSNLREETQKLAAALKKLENFIGAKIHRKRMELEYQHLFDSLPDLICTADFKGRFLKINKAGAALLEYVEAELIGQSFDKFIHPADRENALANAEKLLSGGNLIRFENRFITKSGKVRWFSWNCNTSKEDGLIFASSKDITSEKKLQELVEDANSLARIGGWEIDLVQETLYWSDLVHKMHGTDPLTYTPNLAEGIRFYREDFRELVATKVQQTTDTGEPLDFEAIIITTQGKELWVRVIGRAEWYEGACTRIYGSFQDIHDRKTTELTLESLRDDLPGVSFQYLRYPDGTDELRSVNRTSYEIWALAPEICMKDNALVWDQIRKGGDLEMMLKTIESSITNRSKWHASWRNILPDGQERWHEGYGTPYFYPDGTVLFNSLIFDITDEKKATRLYEETSQMARVGSWELNLLHQQDDTMYWSPMVKEILEVEENYNPSLSGGFEFYEGESRDRIQLAVNRLIQEQEPFDEELLIRTAKGKQRWIRCIGKGEFAEGKCVRIIGSYQDIHERKSLELRIQQILDSIGDAFFTMGRNFTVTYWNRRAEELLNVKREEVLGKNLWEVFPDAINLPSYTKYQQVLETREAVNFEDYYGIWLEVNAYPSEEGVSVFFRDISLRKEADARLQKAYEERTTILESIGDAFFAVDNNWMVTYWNKMAEEVLFRKKADIVGKHLWTEYADAIDSDFYRMYHRAKETGEMVSFEDYYSTLGKWFEVTAYPSEAGLSVYFKDITLRKETDIRIREANERFEKVSEATNEAIWDWNIPENTLYWGSGFQTIFGYDIEKLSPTLESWSNYIPEAEREHIISSFIDVVKDPAHQVWEKEYQYLKANGSIAQVVDRAIIIRDAKGEAIRAVGALQDITYRKKIEKELKVLNEDLKVKIRELEQANEELEQFAFIASHDLQEPLRMVSSFMEQLKRKYGSELDYKAHQYIHYAMDGAKRMKKIILDLLDYSRAGQVTGEMEKVNLDEIVKDYLYLRNKLFTEKQAKLLMDSLPAVRVYKVPLIQTLHSLLDNAVKYSRPDSPPEIHLTVESREKEWVIAVKDNGIGIQKQHFDKIFVIFQRLHNRDQFEGTGIGLAMVKKHVESWGGRVWVESEPGKGSTFYFTINR